MSTGLYIHVPFCVKKCPYCDFYSVSDHSSEIYKKYTDAVLRNIQEYIRKYPSLSFDTVYFGGGTPSVMPVSFYEKVLSLVSHVCDMKSSEITIELNPQTADYEKLKDLRSTGINRLSVGVQSAVDSELHDLGRIHDSYQACQTINDAHAAGFENISADLMTGIKGQTAGSLLKSICTLSELPVKHISAYMLKIEENTEYFRKGFSKLIPDEDETADLYFLTVSSLEERGFYQYEISNFAFKGYESRHNLKYWHCEEYIGIGPSAHSYFNGKRYEVPRELENFVKSDTQHEIVNELMPADFFEKAMLALRLTEGLDLRKYPLSLIHI